MMKPPQRVFLPTIRPLWIGLSLVVLLGFGGCALRESGIVESGDGIVFSDGDSMRAVDDREVVSQEPFDDLSSVDPGSAITVSGGIGPTPLPESMTAVSDSESVSDWSDELSSVFGDVSHPGELEFVINQDLSDSRRSGHPSALKIIWSDQAHFYRRQNVRPGLLTLGAASILANTTMDQEFADWYQDDVRSHSLNQIADFSKAFGEQWPMVALIVRRRSGAA